MIPKIKAQPMLPPTIKTQLVLTAIPLVAQIAQVTAAAITMAATIVTAAAMTALGTLAILRAIPLQTAVLLIPAQAIHPPVTPTQGTLAPAAPILHLPTTQVSAPAPTLANKL